MMGADLPTPASDQHQPRLAARPRLAVRPPPSSRPRPVPSYGDSGEWRVGGVPPQAWRSRRTAGSRGEGALLYRSPHQLPNTDSKAALPPTEV